MVLNHTSRRDNKATQGGVGVVGVVVGVGWVVGWFVVVGLVWLFVGWLCVCCSY